MNFENKGKWQKQIAESIQQKNEGYPKYSNDQLIKAASMLKTIATNSKAINVTDAMILLKASVILADNKQAFIAGESSRFLEAVTKDGMDYAVSKLPKDYKITNLQKYGQLNTNDELKKAVDKEVERLKKLEKNKDNNVQKFINKIMSLLKKNKDITDLKSGTYKADSIKSNQGSQIGGTGYTIEGKFKGRGFKVGFVYYFDGSSNPFFDFDDSGNIKRFKTIKDNNIGRNRYFASPEDLVKAIEQNDL